MTYSQTGLHLTEHFEGCRLVAYKDQAGVWTIGYGHTLGVEPGDRCTRTQAICWLLADAKNAEHYVGCLVRVPLTQGEYDALVDFVFNVGTGNFQRSTLLKKLNGKDYAGAAAEFQKWKYAGGRECRDLLIRRMQERAEFMPKLLWPIVHNDKLIGYAFWCPGCKSTHPYYTVNVWGNPIWIFDGNLNEPTFHPSLLCSQTSVTPRCHLYLTKGMLQYQPDCQHALAGKTIPLPLYSPYGNHT